MSIWQFDNTRCSCVIDEETFEYEHLCNYCIDRDMAIRAKLGDDMVNEDDYDC